MITVSILINGETIYTRSAVNRSKDYFGRETKDGRVTNAYKVDDDKWIMHKPNKGAVELAIKMLRGIKEVK